MMIVIVIMIVALPCSQDLASLLIKIAFLLDPCQFDFYPLKFVLQITICCLKVVSLLKSLATTILSVATVLQRTSLLLQAYDLRKTGGFLLRTNSLWISD